MFSFQYPLPPCSIPKKTSFQDDEQTYQEHQDCYPVNNVHGLNIDIFWPVRVFTSEKIASNLS
jgi:hypothetical protein